MPNPLTTILGSGVALGVYIPAVRLERRLRELNHPAAPAMLENIMLADKREKIPGNKFAFHRNFKLALTGQKMAKDITPHLDPDAVEALLAAWRQEDRRNFIVFSGFWMPVVERYLAENPQANFQLCHLDAEVSTSWKPYQQMLNPRLQHHWFFSASSRKVGYWLDMDGRDPLPYASRNQRYVIHGGGWGMGTYQSKIPELEARGLELDIIAYEPEDLASRHPRSRYFMIDPKWKPWEPGQGGRYRFPPFAQVTDTTPVFQASPDFSDVLNLIRVSQAIISKPGGATLLDSLATATPIVLLEPFGGYEQANADLWEALGFGIRYDTWIGRGCLPQDLEALHRNLLAARTRIPEYAEAYHANAQHG